MSTLTVFLVMILLIAPGLSHEKWFKNCLSCHSNLDLSRRFPQFDPDHFDNYCRTCHERYDIGVSWFHLDNPTHDCRWCHSPNNLERIWCVCHIWRMKEVHSGNKELCWTCHGSNPHQIHINVDCERCHGGEEEVYKPLSDCIACHGEDLHGIHEEKKPCDACHGKSEKIEEIKPEIPVEYEIKPHTIKDSINKIFDISFWHDFIGLFR